jgi:DUF4097 and DUF4098 domain-containing protein YvlB
MSMPAAARSQVVRVTTTSGGVEVVAEPGRSDVSADGTATIDRDGPVTTLRDDGRRMRVRVPEGARVIVGSTSASVRIRGRVGDLAVVTSSGSVWVEVAESVDVRTRSGSVRIRDVAHECRVATTSGRVEVERCGPADVTTRSGRIQLRAAHGPTRVHCVSGRIELQMAGPFDVHAETVSGRVAVELPAGVRARVVTDGPDPDDVDPFDCVVVVRSLSGRVDVTQR